jgi:hypothetical protein
MIRSAIVRFLRLCFQPRFDQMEHGAINNPARM